jgi:mycothiol synthase
MEPGYRQRPSRADDAVALVDLFRGHEIADHGRVTADWDEIVPFVFRNPGFTPAEDGRTVERDGRVVAFTGVFREDAQGLEPFNSWIVADRDHQRAVLPSLLDWDVGRALDRGAAILRHLAYRNDEEYRDQLVRRGFRRVRSMWTMHKLLGLDEHGGGPPAGITFTTLAEHADERALFHAEQEAFSEHFAFTAETFDEWHQRRFRDEGDRGRWFLALDGDQIVAFLCEVTGGEMAQVASLGTRRAWRGRGIATALLRSAFARMRAAGHAEVTLSVDAQNETGAVGLYESVGMRPIVIDDTYELALAGLR